MERSGNIDLWVDTRINAGQNWREEIENALNRTKVGILLLTPEFLASDFIVENEIPPLLKAVEKDDAKILQLFVRPCSIKSYEELSKFQMVNDPKKPLAALSQVEQDEVLVKLAETVESYISED